MGYETLWITPNPRTTAPPRGGAAPARPELTRGGPPGARLGELGVAVAACLAAGRRRSLGPRARARPTAEVDRRTTPPMTQPVAARRQRQRVSPRALDVDPHRGGDSGPLWGALSPRARLEDPARLALALSGAGAPGGPARRPSHGALEALPVAREKQQPAAWAPPSPSWMQVAFGSAPRGGEPGPRWGRRRSSHTTTHMTAARRWWPSPSPRSASTGVCTAAASRATSSRSRSPTAC